MAMVLQEGIDVWLGSPVGWQEGDMASVSDNGGRPLYRRQPVASSQRHDRPRNTAGERCDLVEQAMLLERSRVNI
jgi:hypothetical protein